MDLATLLRLSEEELAGALKRSGELDAEIAEEARVLVRPGEDGGLVGDLRVKGNTVVLVREREHHRFRQRLKEQIALHVSRDRLPDLTGM